MDPNHDTSRPPSASAPPSEETAGRPPQQRRAPLALLLGATLSLAASGCAEGVPRCNREKAAEPPKLDHVLVEYRRAAISGQTSPPKITQTPQYVSSRSSLRSVALRLPDNCFARGALSTGFNTSTAVLESACGVPLQVLERVLSTAGYRVLSWSTLLTIEREQRVPVHIAAQQIGADFVVIVNDLTPKQAESGGEASASYKYFVSSPAADRQGPMELYQEDRNWLKGFVRQHIGDDPQAQNAVTAQARLSATVVVAKGAEVKPGETLRPDQARSGEAIWFYDWSIAKTRGEAGGMRFLFAGQREGDRRHKWWPVAPEAPVSGAPKQSDRATAEESFATRTQVSQNDIEELYQKVVEDFIKRFQGGT